MKIPLKELKQLKTIFLLCLLTFINKSAKNTLISRLSHYTKKLNLDQIQINYVAFEVNYRSKKT